MKLLTSALFASLSFGQVLINSGGPAVNGFQPDSFCSGSRWTPATPGYDAKIGVGIWADMVYGPTFTCDVSLPNGSYRLVLDLEENRAASSVPATLSAIGSRVFSITANGVSTGTLDLFSLVGPQRPYQATLAVQVTNNHLLLNAAAIPGSDGVVRNALMSGFEVYPAIVPLLSTDATPAGILVLMADGSYRTVGVGTGLTFENHVLQISAPLVADWQCNIPSEAPLTPTCTGMQYLAVRRPDGSVIKLFAGYFNPSVPPVIPPNWVPFTTN